MQSYLMISFFSDNYDHARKKAKDPNYVTTDEEKYGRSKRVSKPKRHYGDSDETIEPAKKMKRPFQSENDVETTSSEDEDASFNAETALSIKNGNNIVFIDGFLHFY